MKPTYNPSKLRRARKFGFRKRNQTASGRKVLKSRRQKGRARLTASVARFQVTLLFVRQKFLRSMRLLTKQDFLSVKSSGQQNKN